MTGFNIIQSFIIDRLPPHKRNPNGWYGFNCPACIHNGEPTPDTKKRMGFFHDNTGGVKFHCFRCAYNTSWQPGQGLSRKFKQLLTWLFISDNEIAELGLECLRLKQTYDEVEDTGIKYVSMLKETKLPDTAKPISYWIEQENPPEKFLQAIEYIYSRGEYLLEWFEDFHWDPDPKREDYLIIPLRYRGSVYGYTARLTRPQKNKNEPKYQNHNQGKFMLGADLLDDDRKNYLILVEGALDAIALGAVAILGNQITDQQLEWIKKSNKTIVVLADKDVGGQKLIDVALKNGWMVSFPEILTDDLKDGLDLVNRYGRLMAVKMIFDSATANTLKISMMRKNWINDRV